MTSRRVEVQGDALTVVDGVNCQLTVILQALCESQHKKTSLEGRQ